MTIMRSLRIDGEVAYIPLTKGYEAIIDAADAPLVADTNWCVLARRNTSYAVSNRPGRGNGLIRLHRLIMGDPDGLEIDHIDGDGLNNRRANLRTATHAENMRNRKIGRANTSGFKGAHWSKQFGKWRAEIADNGRNRFLGYYGTLEEAHAAYAKASAEIHGKFGRTK